MKVAISQIKIAEDRQRQDLGDVESLAGSLARVGLINPVIIDEEMNLIAGERRLRAAMYNGWEEIEVRQLGGLSLLEREEMELEENLRRKDLEWTEEVVAVRRLFNMRQERYGVSTKGGARSNVFNQLAAEGGEGYSLERAAEELERGKSSINFDIQLAEALEEFPELEKEATKTSAWRRYRVFKETALRAELAKRTRNVMDDIHAADEEPAGDIAALIEAQGATSSGASDEGTASVEPAIPAHISTKVKKVGWKGKGLLYHADARDVLKYYPEASVDLVVTDPPFGLGMFKGGTATGGGRLTDTHGDMYDDDPHTIMDMLDQVFGLLRRVTKPEGQLYVFFHMTRYEQVYLMLREHFGEQAVDETPIVWIKNTPGIGDPQRSWVYAYEPFFHVNRGKRLLTKPQAFNYLKYDTVPPGQKIHPMAKPPALLRHIISASAVPGEVVLDPFAGSGSTLVAAAQLGCRFLGIERHEPFYRATTEHLAEVLATVEEEEVKGDEVPAAV